MEKKKYEKSGEKEFIIGYEESYGYMVGDYVRDKDAVTAAMLMAIVADKLGKPLNELRFISIKEVK